MSITKGPGFKQPGAAYRAAAGLDIAVHGAGNKVIEEISLLTICYV